MKIGVVGYGVVGKAVTEGFRKHGHQVYPNDVRRGEECYWSKVDLALQCDLIFICVPTPTNLNGIIDLTALHTVARMFYDLALPDRPIPPLVIKSTVLPGTCRRLNCLYAPALHFSSNPEFMTASNALNDFLEADRTIVGTDFPEMHNVFMELYKDFPGHLIMTDSTSAELSKYMSNIFLVHKVAFALTMGRCADYYRVNPEVLYAAVGSDKRIGNSHLNPTKGKIPRDSPCLPKDLQAFISEMEVCKQDEILSLLKVIQKIGIDEK